MSKPTDKLTEGWGFPGLSRKAHYFRGARSLCRKWMFTGHLEPDTGTSADDCAACSRALHPKKPRPGSSAP